MKRCSWCGRIVKEDLLLCSHCHHSFSVSKSSAKKSNKDVKKVRNVSTAVACSKANDKYNNSIIHLSIQLQSIIIYIAIKNRLCRLHFSAHESTKLNVNIVTGIIRYEFKISPTALLC